MLRRRRVLGAQKRQDYLSEKRQEIIKSRQDMKDYYETEVSLYEDEAKILEEKEQELIKMLEMTQEKEVKAYDELKDAIVESAIGHKQRIHNLGQRYSIDMAHNSEEPREW